MSWEEPKKEMEPVTLDKLESLCTLAYDLKGHIDGKVRELDAVKAELQIVQKDILAVLTHYGNDSYRSNKGLVSVSKRLSVKVPSEPSKRQAFFDHLKKNDIFEGLITVNSATLNAYYKEEFAAAAERGDAYFAVPGIDTPTVYEKLNMRKK